MASAARSGARKPVVFPKGHITSRVLQTDQEPVKLNRRQRRRRKLTRREKYVFKKMCAKHRQRMTRSDDLGSDLTPLYDMIHPWNGFSQLTAKERDNVKTEAAKYTPQETNAIASLRKTVYDSVKLRQNRNRVKNQWARDPTLENENIDFYRSAEVAERLQNSEEIAERMAMKSCERNVGTKPSKIVQSRDDQMTVVDRTRARDPTFQQSALRFERESEGLEDVDEWIHKLRAFAAEHGETIDTLYGPDKDVTSTNVHMSTDLEDMLKQQMIEKGINLQNVERQAFDELKREILKGKTKRQPTPRNEHSR